MHQPLEIFFGHTPYAALTGVRVRALKEPPMLRGVCPKHLLSEVCPQAGV
jgi:hypothetical protein